MNRGLLLLTVILIGIAIGLGAFTFVYAKGASYLSNDPAACANCHIMSEHYAAWSKASHHTVATCNDCHTPHNYLGKYSTKARNGFWHSFYFTTGRFPYPLRITERNREVTEHACRYCHEAVTAAIDHGSALEDADIESRDHGMREPEEISCIRCHRYVGHWVR